MQMTKQPKPPHLPTSLSVTSTIIRVISNTAMKLQNLGPTHSITGPNSNHSAVSHSLLQMKDELEDLGVFENEVKLQKPKSEAKYFPLPSFFSYLLSPISYLLSPISYLLSPFSFLLIPFSYPYLLSPISYLLSPFLISPFISLFILFSFLLPPFFFLSPFSILHSSPSLIPSPLSLLIHIKGYKKNFLPYQFLFQKRATESD
jgi:hypothetical protein